MSWMEFIRPPSGKHFWLRCFIELLVMPIRTLTFWLNWKGHSLMHEVKLCLEPREAGPRIAVNIYGRFWRSTYVLPMASAEFEARRIVECRRYLDGKRDELPTLHTITLSWQTPNATCKSVN
jgi:hypothetical protein